MEEREPSISVTHLVTQIAQNIADHAIEIYDLNLDQRVMDIIDEKFPSWGADIDGKIPMSSHMGGGPWSCSEDTLLSEEVSLAITSIASRHRRSKGAIKSRIRQRGLI